MIIFRVGAALAGLFFVVAVVLMASAPWALLQPDQEVNTELNRWFLSVAGSVDAITAGVLLALAQRPRRTLLIVELAGAVIVAGAIILPFQPTFAAILAIGVIPLLAYPYWRDVGRFRSWWAGVSRPLLILAALAGLALLVTAAVALPRQIGGTDQAAHAGWWSDYAEHATVLALAGVLAASHGPGCRILRGLCSAVWLYLGLVAARFAAGIRGNAPLQLPDPRLEHVHQQPRLQPGGTSAAQNWAAPPSSCSANIRPHGAAVDTCDRQCPG